MTDKTLLGCAPIGECPANYNKAPDRINFRFPNGQAVGLDKIHSVELLGAEQNVMLITRTTGDRVVVPVNNCVLIELMAEPPSGIVTAKDMPKIQV